MILTNMQSFLGAFAVVLGFVSYVPYFRGILAGKTKPHAFSWLVWSMVNAIAFFAQVSSGGGAGAWVTGFTTLACAAVTMAAMRNGWSHITRMDWVFFAGSLAALALWLVTKDPLGSVILVTIIDILAFVPTLRKSYHKPDEESASLYALSAVKFAISLAALSALTLTTVLYPLSLVVTNGLFAALILWRRNQFKAEITQPF
ncbi:MAG: hypothetical protein JWP13_166 [Candidatus Saccharibacteria bacterium]|nr:hypothetical protein [Candidatus Saccharibacteria bacterium]